MTDADLIDKSTHNEEPALALTGKALVAALMALLFAAGDPLSADHLMNLTGADKEELSAALQRLEQKLKDDPESGLALRRIEDRYTLSTRPEQKEILELFFQPKNRPRLTQASFEVLAVVAYNQPVTRAQIEAVRGVNSDSIISRLEERGYIFVSGTLEAPGRPSLFSTTEKFLLETGIGSLAELPPMEMIQYSTLREFEQKYEQRQSHEGD